tara:strand:+ start:285 stop:665 length:381 start_codon:yes stop_codon:yes gene_type:complete
MKIIDKVILVLLAIEHLGFGFYGLYAPESIAEIVGYELLSEFAFSELRANYALFTILGLLALFSIFFNNLVKGTYFVYIVIFGSFIIGRVLNFLFMGDMQTSIIITIFAELVVVVLCTWRIKLLKI